MKKFAKIAAVGLLLLVLVLVLWPTDKRPVPDADLQLNPPKVADSENGFFLIEDAGEAVQLTDPQRDQLSDLLKANSADAQKLGELLSANKEALNLLNRGLDLPALHVPAITNFDTLLPYLSTWKSLALLGAGKARHSFLKGKEKQAFDEAMEVIEFGQRSQSNGVWISYLVAVAVKGIGLREVRHLTAHARLKPAELRPYIDQLSIYASNYTAISNVIKAEYRVQVSSINQMASGRYPGSTNSAAARIGLAMATRPLFNQRKTQELFAGIARTNLAAVSQPFNSMTRNAKRIGSTNFVSLALSGNPMGKVLASLMLPVEERFMERKCNENVEIAATRLLLALRCYQLERGSLPDSLESLVPDYIAAIPLDDFDGKPMRYANKTIYSVGKDLIDSGGNPKDDVTFKVEF